VFFQDLDIRVYAFTPEKTPSLVGQNIDLASGFFRIYRIFGELKDA